MLVNFILTFVHIKIIHATADHKEEYPSPKIDNKHVKRKCLKPNLGCTEQLSLFLHLINSFHLKDNSLNGNNP